MEMDAKAANNTQTISAPLTPTSRTPETRKQAQVSPVWPPPSNVKYNKVHHIEYVKLIIPK